MKEFKFVVFENEPEYPTMESISKIFFGKYNEVPSKNGYPTDFVKEFSYVKDYFYRLEMADLKELNRLYRNEHKEYSYHDLTEKIAFYQDRINFAKYKQWEAAECINLYQHAGQLLEDKKTEAQIVYFLEQKVIEGGIDSSIAYLRNSILETKGKMRPIEEQIRVLRNKISAYREIKEANKVIKDDYHTNTEEEKLINERTKHYNKMLKDLRAKVQEYKELIQKQEAHIVNCHQDKITYAANLKEHSAKLDSLKAQLTPYFNKLKNFYIEKGIRL